MSERTFLIQRYCTGNWPQVKGEVPFLATGPKFSEWAYGLERFGEWRFVSDLKIQFEDVFGQESDPRHSAAWALLETGIVQALWTEHTEVPESDRWLKSVDQLASEIPKGMIGDAVIEYLSGLSAPSHFRSYVAEDQIQLIELAP